MHSAIDARLRLFFFRFILGHLLFLIFVFFLFLLRLLLLLFLPLFLRQAYFLVLFGVFLLFLSFLLFAFVLEHCRCIAAIAHGCFHCLHKPLDRFTFLVSLLGLVFGIFFCLFDEGIFVVSLLLILFGVF